MGDLYLEPYDPTEHAALATLTPKRTATRTSYLASPQPTTIAPPLPTVPEVTVDPISAQDRTKYAGLFASCEPVQGELDGEKARAVFLRSKLPVDQLAHIWTLVDTKNRGKLNVHEFTAAMHLIRRVMDGSIRKLPIELPPGLMPPDKEPAAFSFEQAFEQPSAVVVEEVAWSIDAEEKERFNVYFDALDKQKSGKIAGMEAATFFKNSQLPEVVLADIWTLADITKDGHLSRDEFAVAMHLIHGKLAGKPIPPTLPYALVPPTLRSLIRPPPTTMTSPQRDILQSAFSIPPSYPATMRSMPDRRESLDLFRDPVPAPVSKAHTELMDLFSAPTTSPRGNLLLESNSPVAAMPSPKSHDPFGLEALTHEPPPTAPEPSFSTDPKIAEIQKLQRDMQDQRIQNDRVKQQRASMEADAQELATKRRDLSIRLAQAQAMHDAENRALKEVQAVYEESMQAIASSKIETERLERELVQARMERERIQQQLETNQQTSTDLKRRLRIAQEELEKLKADKLDREKELNLSTAMLQAEQHFVTKAEQQVKTGVVSSGQQKVSSPPPSNNNPFQGRSPPPPVPRKAVASNLFEGFEDDFADLKNATPTTSDAKFDFSSAFSSISTPPTSIQPKDHSETLGKVAEPPLDDFDAVFAQLEPVQAMTADTSAFDDEDFNVDSFASFAPVSTKVNSAMAMFPTLEELDAQPPPVNQSDDEDSIVKVDMHDLSK
jgi:epidermal growth factor receptor substrate 15